MCVCLRQARVIPNNDINRTYSVVYLPKVEGLHKVRKTPLNIFTLKIEIIFNFWSELWTFSFLPRWRCCLLVRTLTEVHSLSTSPRPWATQLESRPAVQDCSPWGTWPTSRLTLTFTLQVLESLDQSEIWTAYVFCCAWVSSDCVSFRGRSWRRGRHYCWFKWAPGHSRDCPRKQRGQYFPLHLCPRPGRTSHCLCNLRWTADSHESFHRPYFRRWVLIGRTGPDVDCWFI